MIGMAGVALGLCAAMAPLALAQSYNGNSVYKVTRSNGEAQVIVANRTPGDRVEVTFPNAKTSARVTANGCGLVVLRDSATRPVSSLLSVDGAAIDHASLPTQLLPRCVNGALEEARTVNFRTGAGEVVVVKTPNTVYEAVFTGGRSRSVTANACGYAVINGTAAAPWSDAANKDFSIGGTAYNIDTLTTASLEPLCRSGQLYVPDAWP
jgi:hypothetical protein